MTEIDNLRVFTSIFPHYSYNHNIISTLHDFLCFSLSRFILSRFILSRFILSRFILSRFSFPPSYHFSLSLSFSMKFDWQIQTNVSNGLFFNDSIIFSSILYRVLLYLWSEHLFVYIAGEHGAGREDRAVCWWHHSRRDGTQSQIAHKGGSQVVQDQRQDQFALIGWFWLTTFLITYFSPI